MRALTFLTVVLLAGCSFLTPQVFDGNIQLKVNDLYAQSVHMASACNLLISEQERKASVSKIVLDIKYQQHWLDAYVRNSENKEFIELWRNVGILVDHVYEHPGDTPKACTGSAQDLASTYESVLQVMGRRK